MCPETNLPKESEEGEEEWDVRTTGRINICLRDRNRQSDPEEQTPSPLGVVSLSLTEHNPTATLPTNLFKERRVCFFYGSKCCKMQMSLRVGQGPECLCATWWKRCGVERQGPWLRYAADLISIFRPKFMETSTVKKKKKSKTYFFFLLLQCFSSTQVVLVQAAECWR